MWQQYASNGRQREVGRTRKFTAAQCISTQKYTLRLVNL